MFFVRHPQILHKHCLQFLLGVKWPQEKLKTMLMQNLGVTNKEHYGMLWYFLEWSIESNEEWNVLKDTINKFPGKGTEYYIGLTKDKDGNWTWISNNSTVNKSYWAPGQPKDTNSACAVMYKDYNGNCGLFDDLPCTFKRQGYICESEYHVMC